MICWMSEGMTAREDVPNGIAKAATLSITKQPKIVRFFIKPLGNTHLDAEWSPSVNPG
jgi:hypothetical protein